MEKSKVHHRSLNLFGCVISVPNLQIDRLGPQTYSSGVSWSSNLFGHVISVSKLKNHPIRFSNLFNCVIPVSKLDFESHLGQNNTIHNFFI